ncbi:MAG: hypothetical protein R3E89_03625 [Thiolinea sp.]
MAAELLEINARRAARKGHSFDLMRSIIACLPEPSCLRKPRIRHWRLNP